MFNKVGKFLTNWWPHQDLHDTWRIIFRSNNQLSGDVISILYELIAKWFDELSGSLLYKWSNCQIIKSFCPQDYTRSSQTHWWLPYSLENINSNISCSAWPIKRLSFNCSLIPTQTPSWLSYGAAYSNITSWITNAACFLSYLLVCFHLTNCWLWEFTSTKSLYFFSMYTLTWRGHNSLDYKIITTPSPNLLQARVSSWNLDLSFQVATIYS